MTLERRLKLVTMGTGEGETGPAVKVAFATSDMKRVDQHFGAAESFAIYSLDAHRATLLEAVGFGRLAMDGNEDKLSAKIGALDGCAAVYCQAIGGSAIGQLRAKGIQAMKVQAGSPIKVLIDALQDDLRHGPSAWLARAIAMGHSGDTGRFDLMEQEGWIE